jgi:hypothetical protein
MMKGSLDLNCFSFLCSLRWRQVLGAGLLLVWPCAASAQEAASGQPAAQKTARMETSAAPATNPGANSSVIPGSGLGPVVLTGGQSNTVMNVGDESRIWVTIRNDGNPTLKNVRLAQLVQLHTGTYTVKQVCVYGAETHCWKSAEEDCSPGAVAEGAGIEQAAPTVPELQSGQSATIFADLHACEDRENQNLMAMVGWTLPNGTLSRAGVPLGANSIRGGWNRLWTGTKELAVPIFLALLGALLAYLNWRREQLAKELDQKRENADKAHADLRAQAAQTWEKMLPQSHEYATKYYMPLQGALKGLLDSSTTLGSELSFYYWALFERRNTHLVREAGGFYFKDRVGEELVIQSYEMYRTTMTAGTTDQERKADMERISRLMTKIEPQETLASFEQKRRGVYQVSGADATETVETRTILRENFDAFKKQLADPAAAHHAGVDYLRVYEAVLAFEMNRPYEYWYGRLDEPTKKMLTEVKKEIAKDPSRKNVADDIDRYIREALSTKRTTEAEDATA